MNQKNTITLPSKHQIIKCHSSKWIEFEHLHFVDRRPICVTECFYIPPDVACIIYAYPPLSSRLRRKAHPGKFNTGTRSEIARMVNRNIRVISRIAVRKDLQQHHIGTNLIKNTLSRIIAPCVEAFTNLFGASKCLQNAGMTRYMYPPDNNWFQIEQLYKELDIPRTSTHTNIELFSILEKLPTEKKIYYRKIALKYLSQLRCYCPHWSLLGIHQELIKRRDQQPFYFFWKNPQKRIITKPN